MATARNVARRPLSSAVTHHSRQSSSVRLEDGRRTAFPSIGIGPLDQVQTVGDPVTLFRPLPHHTDASSTDRVFLQAGQPRTGKTGTRFIDTPDDAVTMNANTALTQ